MCVFNSDFQLLGKVDMNNLIILIRHHDQIFAVCLLEKKDMLLKNNSSGCSPKARELSQTSLGASLAFYNDKIAKRSSHFWFLGKDRGQSENCSLWGTHLKLTT